MKTLLSLSGTVLEMMPSADRFSLGIGPILDTSTGTDNNRAGKFATRLVRKCSPLRNCSAEEHVNPFGTALLKKKSTLRKMLTPLAKAQQPGSQSKLDNRLTNQSSTAG